MTEPAAPPTGREVAATYALVLVLTLLLALWGAFLVPLRVGATLVPVSWVVGAVGNALLGVWGGRLLGKVGVLAPVLLWLVVVIALSSARSEGDLVLTVSTATYGFLLSGAVGGFVAYGLHVTRPGAPPR